MLKQIGSFSGGRTSAYLCHLMIEKFGRENCEFVYCDTGAEHPRTYDFIRQVNQAMDLNLTCLRVDINYELGESNSYKEIDINDLKSDLQPFQDMMKKYGTPYFGGAFCTDRMKSTPFRQYCNDRFGKKNYVIWLGMRIDEPRRLKELAKKQMDIFDSMETKKPKFRYLAEISDFEKQDVLDWWAEQEFDLAIPEPLGNCVFCLKKGLNKIAYAQRLEPGMAKDFMDIIASDSVRVTSREKENAIMYRNHNSLQSIIDKYADFTTEEIEQTIRSMKQLDTGSCSESCEAFSDDNYDLFD